MDLADKMLAWLAPRADEMESLLRKLVNIDSNSFDKAGTDAVGEAIAGLLKADGIAVSRIPKAKFGDVFRAEVPGQKQTGHVLLLGHRDTVFAKGTVASRGYSRKGDLAFGPGVADMKAGLVTNIFALRAINAVGGLPFPVMALFTSDEEIGSPTNRAEIEMAAKGARAVFNSEPGRVSGNVVTGRKGGARSISRSPAAPRIPESITRRAPARSRRWPARSCGCMRSPIMRRGITTNVGVIKGGNTHNTVAPWAEAELDLRFMTLEQRAEIMSEIEKIVSAEDVRARARRSSRSRCFCRSKKSIRRTCSRSIGRRRRGWDLPLAESSLAAAPIPGLPPRSACQPYAASDRSAEGTHRR